MKEAKLFLLLAVWSVDLSVAFTTPSTDRDKQIAQVSDELRNVKTELGKVKLEKQKMADRIEKLEAAKASATAVEGGVTYIRWGRTECNITQGAVQVHAGYAAGSRYLQPGGGSNILCIPEDPEFDAKMTGELYPGWLHGIEYQFEYDYTPNGPFSPENNGGQPLNGNPAPCSVCYVPTRTAKLMIPGRKECPSGWTKEYGGYVGSQRDAEGDHRSSHNCWDAVPEIAVGGIDLNQALVFPVKVGCGTLPCSNYDSWEVTCVVCTR